MYVYMCMYVYTHAYINVFLPHFQNDKLDNKPTLICDQ